jgi:hypothetical protein
MIDIAALRAQIGFGPRVGIDASTLRALCDALEQSQSRERVLREALGMVIGDIEAGEANHSLSFARAALQAAEDTGYSQVELARRVVVEAAKAFLSEMAPLLDSDHRAELREAVRALEELEAK